MPGEACRDRCAHLGSAHPWNWCEECALPVAIPDGAPDGTFVTCSICAAVYAVTLLQGCEFILEPRKPDPIADGQPLGVAVHDIAAGENVIAGSMVAPVRKAVP